MSEVATPPAAAPAAAAPAAAPAPAAVAPPSTAAAAPAAAPAPAAAAAPTPAPTPAKSPLLGGTDPAADPWASVPEKYHVKDDKGEIDKNATLAKVEQARGELEKRLGRPDVRPKSHAEYTVPETAKEIVKTDDPKTADFLKAAFNKGFSQSQLDFVLEEFATRAPALVQGAQALDAEAAETSLRSVWKTDEDFDLNLDRAERAVRLLGTGIPDLMQQVQNRPGLVQFLARVGEQLQEDTPPPNLAGKGGETADAYMKANWDAYSDHKHKDHDTVNARVNALRTQEMGARGKIEIT